MMGTPHKSRAFWPILAALTLCGAVWARADLAAASPFMPANTAAAAAAGGPSGPIELRGVMSMSDGVAYCIYDVVKKKATWVGLNESGHDFVVKSADANSDSVTVSYQGRSLNLALRTAKVSSAGTPQVPSGMPNAVASSVVPNPSPADEQRRLDAVSQEVRRRRLERERTLQELNQPANGVPPAVPNR